MLGKFSRKHKADGSLNFTRRESRFLVVASQLASLKCNAFKDIIDEGVHDGHSPLTNSGIGVNLLQHLVDVGAVGFNSLGALSLVHGFLGGLRGFLTRSLCHFQRWLYLRLRKMTQLLVKESHATLQMGGYCIQNPRIK